MTYTLARNAAAPPGLTGAMPPIFPAWLHGLAATSVVVGLVCAGWIAADVLRRPQKMWIMALVWPLTALFGGIVWLAGYLRFGRTPVGGGTRGEASFPAMVFKGSSHCGAGCTLGDLVAEWLAFAMPGVTVALGYRTVFAERTYAVWVLDFILAFILGVGFQYYTIKPMRDLTAGAGIVAALKADAASISAWQVGMYGAMALIQFAWFRPSFGAIAPVGSVEFWFAMQIAMLAGFATSYPVNWWLIRIGVKEAM